MKANDEAMRLHLEQRRENAYAMLESIAAAIRIARDIGYDARLVEKALGAAEGMGLELLR